VTSIIREVQKHAEWVSAQARRLPAAHLRLFLRLCGSSSGPIPSGAPGVRFLPPFGRVFHALKAGQPGYTLFGHSHPCGGFEDCQVGLRKAAWGKAQHTADPHLAVGEAPPTTEMPTSLGGGEHLCPCSNRAMFNGRTSLDGNATAKTVCDWILFHPRA